MYSILSSAQNVTSGLVGYYSFCDCSAKDLSGNNGHGTMAGTPQCVKGIRDNGLLFNQEPVINSCGQPGGQYIQLPALGAIWSQGFTISAWVRFDEVKKFQRIIDFGNTWGDAGGMNVLFGREANTNNLILESWINANGAQARTNGRLIAQNAITNGSIEFYCATISNDTMRIYVNGVLIAWKKGNPILNTARSSNFIGRSNWCADDPDFKGFLDDVRIYNRALSLQDIQHLYKMTGVKDFAVATNCLTKQVAFSVQNTVDVDSLKWDFGEPRSGQQNTALGPDVLHTYADTGTYTARLIAYKHCLNDTLIKKVRIYMPDPYFLGQDFDICPGKSKLLKMTLYGAAFRWQDGSTADSFTVSQPGTYWLQTSLGNCVYRDTVFV
ncbi:MAG TPA: LamG-like jellyroll fold domain-containing protein, partial [Flavisolibacter sp.]|nr:LamG-like jellyroll fold domain-containing protein [Flavisolibacter sp.]